MLCRACRARASSSSLPFRSFPRMLQFQAGSRLSLAIMDAVLCGRVCFQDSHMASSSTFLGPESSAGRLREASTSCLCSRSRTKHQLLCCTVLSTVPIWSEVAELLTSRAQPDRIDTTLQLEASAPGQDPLSLAVLGSLAESFCRSKPWAPVQYIEVGALETAGSYLRHSHQIAGGQ